MHVSKHLDVMFLEEKILNLNTPLLQDNAAYFADASCFVFLHLSVNEQHKV